MFKCSNKPSNPLKFVWALVCGSINKTGVTSIWNKINLHISVLMIEQRSLNTGKIIDLNLLLSGFPSS